VHDLTQKKASLSLSIEAIVVLVLAISLLGLGLGFTKGMFGQLKSQLVVPPPDIPATADDPIVLPTGGTLNIKAAKDAVFTVNFFNNAQTADFTPYIICNNLYLFDLRVSSQQIDAQTYKSFRMIINADTFSIQGYHPPGYNICTIQFYDCDPIHTYGCSDKPVPSKQIIINAE
jgi:hypothetical protein